MNIETYEKLIDSINTAYENAQSELRMKDVIAKQNLELYQNEFGLYFGQKGTFFFFIGEKVNQIDCSNQDEINLYLKWKFAKTTKIVPVLSKEEIELAKICEIIQKLDKN